MTGKKKTESTKKTNRRDAERYAGNLEKQLRDGTYWPRQRTEWSDFRDRYETEVVAGQADGTADKISAVFNVFERHIAPKYLDAIGENEISDFTTKLRKAGRPETTIKGYLAHLRAAFNWAESMGLMRKAPKFRMPKRATGMQGRPITVEEFERILAKLAKVVGKKRVESWRFLLRGFWWSELRRTEAMNLHWTDDRLLCVDFSGKRPMFRIQPKGQKNHKAQVLPMAPEFAERLLAVPEEQRHGYVFNPDPLRAWNGRLKPAQVTRIVSDIAEEAKVKVGEKRSGNPKYATPHELRRSFGFRWAHRVMPAVLQQLMRHETIQTTMQYYLGRDAETAADALWAAVTNTSANTAPKTAPAESAAN